MQVGKNSSVARRETILGVAAISIILSAFQSVNANEVVLIRPEVKPEKVKAPCPVTLNFRALIMADEFGDIEYRWVRSDEEQMPTETLSLPANKRKTSSFVTMSWEVSPLNTPNGREYWADVEVLSPVSLGSSGAARAWVGCDGVAAGYTAEDTSDESSQQSQTVGDDMFELGDADEEDVLVVGEVDDAGASEAPVQEAGPSVRPIEFACPIREIGVRVADPLPRNWERVIRGNTGTGTIAARTVSETAGGVRLVCLYQNGKWLLPLWRPIPAGYATCTVRGDYFRCTG